MLQLLFRRGHCNVPQHWGLVSCTTLHRLQITFFFLPQQKILFGHNVILVMWYNLEERFSFQRWRVQIHPTSEMATEIPQQVHSIVGLQWLISVTQNSQCLDLLSCTVDLMEHLTMNLQNVSQMVCLVCDWQCTFWMKTLVGEKKLRKKHFEFHCSIRNNIRLQCERHNWQNTKQCCHRTEQKFCQLAKDHVDSVLTCDKYCCHFIGCDCLLQKASLFQWHPQLVRNMYLAVV